MAFYCLSCSCNWSLMAFLQTCLPVRYDETLHLWPKGSSMCSSLTDNYPVHSELKGSPVSGNEFVVFVTRMFIVRDQTSETVQDALEILGMERRQSTFSDPGRQLTAGIWQADLPGSHDRYTGTDLTSLADFHKLSVGPGHHLRASGAALGIVRFLHMLCPISAAGLQENQQLCVQEKPVRISKCLNICGSKLYIKGKTVNKNHLVTNLLPVNRWPNGHSSEPERQL